MALLPIPHPVVVEIQTLWNAVGRQNPDVLEMRHFVVARKGRKDKNREKLFCNVDSDQHLHEAACRGVHVSARAAAGRARLIS